MAKGRELARVFGVSQGEHPEDVDNVLVEDEHGVWYTLGRSNIKVVFDDQRAVAFIFLKKFRVAWVLCSYEYAHLDFWAGLLGACCRAKRVLEETDRPTVVDVFQPSEDRPVFGFRLTKDGELRTPAAALGGVGAREAGCNVFLH